MRLGLRLEAKHHNNEVTPIISALPSKIFSLAVFKTERHVSIDLTTNDTIAVAEGVDVDIGTEDDDDVVELSLVVEDDGRDEDLRFEPLLAWCPSSCSVPDSSRGVFSLAVNNIPAFSSKQ